MTPPIDAGPRPTEGAFVAVSNITVPEAGRAALLDAFGQRLGAVDSWPGFKGLQVWADQSDPAALVMVSWWDTEDNFTTYMRSADHRRSHARIPGGPARARPSQFRRYELIAR
ncbi:MAG: antibiotic biosynthesis monooxygenase [Acidimicrobiales bacterium]|nr:antibiotic biosynthesis monooxygenase [Acidimicrobiales bacterium]